MDVVSNPLLPIAKDFDFVIICAIRIDVRSKFLERVVRPERNQELRRATHAHHQRLRGEYPVNQIAHLLRGCWVQDIHVDCRRVAGPLLYHWRTWAASACIWGHPLRFGPLEPGGRGTMRYPSSTRRSPWSFKYCGIKPPLSSIRYKQECLPAPKIPSRRS